MDSLQARISRLIKRYDFHPLQRRLYTYDLLVIPPPLKRFVKVPVCVVQPENDEEVLKVLEIADKTNTPIVPRGAATSAYGGVVPIRDCIVIDLSRMNRFEVEDDKLIAECGAVWWDVEKNLNKIGLALRVYPTSAPASTVGGLIGQGGYGVGSLKYGSIADNIEWLDVADFDGVKRVSGEELKYYVGAFGTTGIILRACIKLRESCEIRSFAVSCDFSESFDRIRGAYHAAYMTKEFIRLSGWNGDDVLLVCFEEDVDFDGDVSKGRFLWDRRFMQLRAARYRRVVFSEVLVPFDKAARFMERGRKMGAGIEVIYAKDRAIFFGIFPADKLYSSLFSALKFVKIAEKLGGSVYSTGLLFPHKNMLGKELAEYKLKVDPKNLLNPGKAMQSNAIANIIKIAEMVM